MLFIICFSQDKVVKFANYFLSRKHVHQLRAAYQLVSVIKTLTDNPVSWNLVNISELSTISIQFDFHLGFLLSFLLTVFSYFYSSTFLWQSHLLALLQ